MQYKTYTYLLMLCFTCSTALAQVSIRDSSINVLLIGIGYGHHLPAADMSQRFGDNSAIAGTVLFKSQSQFVFGVDATFIFGQKIYEPHLFDALDTDNGSIIGTDGKFADVRKYERGYTITANAGYLFALKKPNVNSGIMALMGVGFLQHKIRIEVANNNVPALDKDNRKGYDRLTNGLALRQFVGYHYLSNKHLVNFYIGIDAYQGFTAGRRSYNFDTMQSDNGARLDILIGVRAGWILPLYKKAAEKVYFY